MNPLGFVPARGVVQPAAAPDVRRACFVARKLFAEIVYDTAALEDSPYTFPEVQTLLEGITVGGHRLADQSLVLNQAASWRRLIELVGSGRFALDKETFCELHALVAREEALTWGVFRDGAVRIAGSRHEPPPAAALDELFAGGLAELDRITCPFLKGINFFLFGSLSQFFFDGNKRTSRLMMNGIIMSAGHPPISVPAAKALEFNRTMLTFYETREGREMAQLLLSLAPVAYLPAMPA
ncbi:MAG: Fic family protein [Thermodesulfobacteriota bacterium]